MYGWYQVGYVSCQLLPRSWCFWIARRIADLFARRSPADWQAVTRNLSLVLETPQVSEHQVQEVFRNFGMYLVDFFRFGKLNHRFIRQQIRIEGVEHMRRAIDQGKGAIGLSAHLGNYELAGAVLSLLGFSVKAVVLSHQNPQIDAFFIRQRQRVGVRGIPVQKLRPKQFYEECLSALRHNEILGLVGDRDFFGHGLEMPFFGKPTRIPTGPAGFSVRTSAPIVPAFLVRESDGAYRLIFEAPIFPPKGLPLEEAVRKVTSECLQVMARYIRIYPTQWYMFREFWKPGPALIL